MSTILKALRRLEKERSRSDDRPLRDRITGEPDDGPAPRRAPRRLPLLAASAVVGVFAGVAVLLLFFRSDLRPRAPEPEAPARAAGTPAPLGSDAARAARRAAAERAMRQLAERSSAPVAPEPVAPAAAVAAEPMPTPPAAEPEVALLPPGPPPPAPDVAVIERGTPAPRIADDAPVLPSPEPRAAGGLGRFSPHDPDGPDAPGGPAPEVVAEMQRAAAAGPGALPPHAVAEPPVLAPVPAPAPAAPPAPPVAPPAPTASAVATQKPVAAKTAAKPSPKASARPAEPEFPSLRVERTTWHPSAERRVAVVELPDGGTRELHEGDRVEGAVVEKIEPSGVVFDYRGRSVRRGLAPGS